MRTVFVTMGGGTLGAPVQNAPQPQPATRGPSPAEAEARYKAAESVALAERNYRTAQRWSHVRGILDGPAGTAVLDD